MILSWRMWTVASVLLALSGPSALAQHEHHPTPRPAVRDTTPTHPGHTGTQHQVQGGTMHHAMPAMYGDYPMTREASGTAWQPDVTPHEGVHLMRGPWSGMLHGFATLVWNEQGGPRGADEGMSTSMLMAMGSRPLGNGRLGLRAMFSAEPATLGSDGYALLLQSGETADGVEELIDRQHPHDLFMELAASYAVSDATRSAFVYLGLPGEPALGPPTFMHRYSGMEFPDSPISHHWLDSTHISFGVFSAGLMSRGVKLEGSVFTGREPDEKRYDIEAPKFDSQAVRASWNPTPAWALQLSHGWIDSPEQLHPETDVERTTASVMFGHTPGGAGWFSTLAWGRNRNNPGNTLDAWLLESRLTLRDRHTFLARGEVVEKDELFHEPDPLAGRVFRVGKVTGGYLIDVARYERVMFGLGATGSLIVVPDDLDEAYGDGPKAAMIFARAMLR